MTCGLLLRDYRDLVPGVDLLCFVFNLDMLSQT